MKQSLAEFIKYELETAEGMAFIIDEEMSENEKAGKSALSLAASRAYYKGKIAQLKTIEQAIKQGIVTTLTEN